MTESEKVAYVRGATEAVAALTCGPGIILGAEYRTDRAAERLTEFMQAKGLMDVHPYPDPDPFA